MKRPEMSSMNFGPVLLNLDLRDLKSLKSPKSLSEPAPFPDGWVQRARRKRARKVPRISLREVFSSLTRLVIRRNRPKHGAIWRSATGERGPTMNHGFISLR